MANLKEVLGRIKSIRSIQKTTRVMQMISASKLRRSQQALKVSRLCAESLKQIVGRSVADSFSDHNSGFSKDRLLYNENLKSYVLILIASDRGLCGGFNHAIVKFAAPYIDGLIAQGKNVSLVVCGKKLHDLLKQKYSGIITNFHHQIKDLDDFVKMRHFVYQITQFYQADAVEVIYNHFESTMTQTPVRQTLIPIVSSNDLLSGVSPLSLPKQDNSAVVDHHQSESLYTYEPTVDRALHQTARLFILSSLYLAFVESVTSEHCARMMAMESANRNTKEMLNKLVITYNRTRQAAITTGLIEVIGGAEALN